MFNLDQAIAEWRRRLADAGIKSSEALEELESHLRDDVEQQVRQGADAQQAFEIAAERIGHADALEIEFSKTSHIMKAPGRIKRTFLTLAGIPNHYLVTSMNASNLNIEPRWATYTKATTFLAPAVFLWALSTAFIIPKLQQICANTDGGPLPILIQIMMGVTEHRVLIIGGIILALSLLEWRSVRWPRYRRATIGAGTFLLNTIILLSIFTMVIVAVLHYHPIK